MKTLRIQIKTISRTPPLGGLVSAELSFRLNGFSFPAEDWVDSPIVVLRWWAEAVASLMRTPSIPVEARFMEGPYLVQFRAVTMESWQADFVEAGLNRRSVHTAEFDAKTFVDSLVEACYRALELCSDNVSVLADATQLTNALAILETAVGSVRNGRKT